MARELLKGLGIGLLAGGIIAGYVGLSWLGATPFELVLTTVMVAMVIAVGALVLHLRAMHRALSQHAQVAYNGFMLNFFLAIRGLLGERRNESTAAESDLVWSLFEDYFRREAELYNTVVEELYDKTSMMHMLERGRVRKEPGLGDPRPIEPQYQELHALLGRLREERRLREEGEGRARVAGPDGAG